MESRVSVAARSAIEEPKDEKSRNKIIVYGVGIENCVFIIATSAFENRSIEFSISRLRRATSPNFNVVLQLKYANVRTLSSAVSVSLCEDPAIIHSDGGENVSTLEIIPRNL